MTDVQHFTAAQLMARYRVCRRTIGRWLESETLGFPKPLLINRRRYWRVAEVEAWETARR